MAVDGKAEFLYWELMQSIPRQLGELITLTKDRQELIGLLGALLTPSEMQEIGRRWEIIKLLQSGEQQRAVRDRLKVSIATVTRGSWALKSGNGIWQKLFQRCARTTRSKTKPTARTPRKKAA